MRIRTYLVLMAAAILLPVVLAGGIALDRIREGERQSALRGLRETVRATALLVDREAQGALSALQVLAKSQHLEVQDLPRFHAQAMALNQPPDGWTELLDAQGRQVLNTLVPFGTPMPSAAEPALARQVLSGRQPLVTDLHLGPLSGKLRITINVPAMAGNGTPYVLAQAIAVERWQQVALQPAVPEDWIVAVIDRQGHFIARSHMTAALVGKPARPELVAAAAAADAGLIRHSTVEGVESYDAFAHSELTGWTIAVAAPVPSVDATAARALWLAALGMLLALATAALATAWFGRRFIQAIDGAGRAAMSLGRGETPQEEHSPIREVNALQAHLRDAGALLGLERHSRQAAEAERARLLENETQAREAAQAQVVVKDQFLAMLGHELRTPLAAISGAAALLEADATDPARRARNLAIIQRQSHHLAHIVNDLLDAGRLMAGKIVLDIHPVNLAECVQHCVQALRASGTATGFDLSVQAQDVWVAADPVRVEQIVNNLVNNALKFSPPGARILVTVEHDGAAQQAVVCVRDAGIGMAPELLARIFEPFFQGPPPASRAQSGLGIGLALAAQLVTLHGGVIGAHSPGPGSGSTLRFAIPSIAAPQIAAQAAASSPRGMGRLVYVEDNADARQVMAELLRAFGYDVVEVADGASALPAVLSARPDVVVLDIGLPDMDGYEVARRLRENPGTRDIPRIALTGYGQSSDKDMAARAGFVAHLVKPVDAVELARTIQDVLSTSAADRG